jgi:hypothetical protein
MSDDGAQAPVHRMADMSIAVASSRPDHLKAKMDPQQDQVVTALGGRGSVIPHLSRGQKSAPVLVQRNCGDPNSPPSAPEIALVDGTSASMIKLGRNTTVTRPMQAQEPTSQGPVHVGGPAPTAQQLVSEEAVRAAQQMLQQAMLGQVLPALQLPPATPPSPYQAAPQAPAPYQPAVQPMPVQTVGPYVPPPAPAPVQVYQPEEPKMTAKPKLRPVTIKGKHLGQLRVFCFDVVDEDNVLALIFPNDGTVAVVTPPHDVEQILDVTVAGDTPKSYQVVSFGLAYDYAGYRHVVLVKAG